ncbi:MAG: GNAT family N-acetyltransferase [Bacillota bacterium]|jgi:ribosomal protein S18 acetylase RimI-like enzyme
MQQVTGKLPISRLRADRLSTQALCELWNQAFVDYFVPMQLTRERFMALVRHELVSLPDSFVAFAGGRAVGLALLGLRAEGRKTAGYVAGTAVVPDYRRQGLGRMLMQALLDQAKDLSVGRITLTAVSENASAIQLYQQLGFKIVRHLTCWEKTLSRGRRPKPPAELSLQPVLPREVRSLCSACYRQAPEWQNRPDGEKLQLAQAVLALWKDIPVGYALYAGRDPLHLYQLGVLPEWRRQGIGRELFRYLSAGKPAAQLIYLNHPQEEPEAAAWLQTMGCSIFLKQVEMLLSL